MTRGSVVKDLVGFIFAILGPVRSIPSFCSFLIVSLTFLLGGTTLCAQRNSPDSIFVEDVILIGHKKTRPSVIFREMTFGRGDRIALAELEENVKQSYANLMNTGLFVEAEITYSDWKGEGNLVTFTVTMRETWYIYPVPIFQLADRNFNVWWSEQGRDLDRVNIGGKLSWRNFTGRRDKLRLVYQIGYTREYRTTYELPFVNRAQNLGFSFQYRQQRRREQNYQTIDNQQLFYEDPDRFVYRNTVVDLDLNYRPKLYATHTLRLGYRDESIADTIANHLNPFFFGSENQKRQRFFRLGFQVRRDKRDVREYPWSGSFGQLEIIKEGLGVFGERNGLTTFLEYRTYTPLGENYSLNLSMASKYSPIRSRQPFLENRAVGFGNYGLAGYQFYVVDGLDMLILRTGLRRKIAKGRIDFGKLVFIDAFRYIPWRLVIGGQIDQGWTRSPFDEGRNPLANQYLLGASIGLDLILYYDMVVSARYHRNKLGEGNILLGFNINL